MAKVVKVFEKRKIFPLRKIFFYRKPHEHREPKANDINHFRFVWLARFVVKMARVADEGRPQG
jgi:hypothetical protein